jgi:hypothetical protein
MHSLIIYSDVHTHNISHKNGHPRHKEQHYSKSSAYGSFIEF